MLRDQTVQAAGLVAKTEEIVAETLARLAAQYPDHGSWLRAKSEAAAKQAARERQFAQTARQAAQGRR